MTEQLADHFSEQSSARMALLYQVMKISWIIDCAGVSASSSAAHDLEQGSIFACGSDIGFESAAGMLRLVPTSDYSMISVQTSNSSEMRKTTSGAAEHVLEIELGE